jgi:DNA-binding transcriptional MerR regulator
VDERVVRYYASLGLVDRPLRREGREAIYGRRHLQQILAVKRLQAEGLSLAQVQRRLAGATGEDLQALALPEGVAPHEPPELPEARRLLLIEIAKGVQLLIDPSRAPAAALDPAFPSRILTLLRTSS